MKSRFGDLVPVLRPPEIFSHAFVAACESTPEEADRWRLYSTRLFDMDANEEMTDAGFPVDPLKCSTREARHPRTVG